MFGIMGLRIERWVVMRLKVELRRDAKYFCDDFSPIRAILHEMKARFVAKKRQEDHIFKIYDPQTQSSSKRVKIRMENKGSCLVYVYGRGAQETDIEFDYYQVEDPRILQIFTSLYGKAITVKKTREVWSKDHVVFHLDTVEGVGNIFEMELLRSETTPMKEDAEGYKQLFQRHLLKKIEGSNEDLVAERIDLADGHE